MKSPPAVLQAFAKLCAFDNVGELIVGTYLMYYFRVIERQSGSTRFGSFAFLVSTLSWGLQMSLHFAYGWQKTLTSGPYGIIFASFVSFIFDIPPSFRFTVLGMNFSDKVDMLFIGMNTTLINSSIERTASRIYCSKQEQEIARPLDNGSLSRCA